MLSRKLTAPGSSRPPIPTSRRLRFTYFHRLALTGLLLILPAFAHLTFFGIYPVLKSIYLSFHSWGLAGDPKFVGLANYLQMLKDPNFIHSVTVTVLYSLGLSISLSVISLVVALLFDRQFPLRDFFRAIYFIPVVVPWVVTAIVWNLIYNPS
jgi:ABC-type sugar transport system permease subunit